MSFTPAWDTLDVFTNPKDFGTVATVTPRQGQPFTVAGIYDEPYLNAQIGEYEADTSAPRFTAQEARLAPVQPGDVLTIGGLQYDVLRHPEPDGTGMATVTLARVR